MQILDVSSQRTEIRVAGHFGEWLQGRLGPEGPVALISLPCHELGVRARFSPSETFTLDQTPVVLSESTVKTFLAALDHPAKGHWILNAEMKPGSGAGTSTASLLAIAHSAGISADTEALIRACLMAEGASDPLFFADMETHLWASRQGETLRNLPPCPEFEIVGGFWQQGERTDPDDAAFPDISDLIDPWAEAAHSQNREQIALLASESANRTTALRGPNDEPIAQLALELNALGYVRAHTGSARGLLFAPGKAPKDAMDQLKLAGYSTPMVFTSGARK